MVGIIFGIVLLVVFWVLLSSSSSRVLDYGKVANFWYENISREGVLLCLASWSKWLEPQGKVYLAANSAGVPVELGIIKDASGGNQINFRYLADPLDAARTDLVGKELSENGYEYRSEYIDDGQSVAALTVSFDLGEEGAIARSLECAESVLSVFDSLGPAFVVGVNGQVRPLEDNPGVPLIQPDPGFFFSLGRSIGIFFGAFRQGYDAGQKAKRRKK